jgi:hypothetical protein
MTVITRRGDNSLRRNRYYIRRMAPGRRQVSVNRQGRFPFQDWLRHGTWFADVKGHLRQ